LERTLDEVQIHKKKQKAKKKVSLSPETLEIVQGSSSGKKKKKKHYSAVEKKKRFRQKKKYSTERQFINDKEVQEISRNSSFKSTDQSEMEWAVLRGEVPISRSVAQSEELEITRNNSVDDNLEAKMRRKAEQAAKKQAKFEERMKLEKHQYIQNQMDELESKYRELEDEGVKIEKYIRGEEIDPENRDDSKIYADWFEVVQQKNQLLLFEKELAAHQRELQLRDKQERVEQKIRNIQNVPNSKTISSEEQELLKELLDVIEQRNEVVQFMDEQRKLQESIDPVALMIGKFNDFQLVS